MTNIDCVNMDLNRVCKMDGCSCGYVGGKCKDMKCDYFDYKPIKKEVVNNRKDMSKINTNNWINECARDYVEKLIKKDIGMKIIFDENDLNICPSCNKRVMTDDKYCRCCGQRILID